MSETPESAADRAEARATRRRWITIGELVAIAGLVIAGLSFYESWSDRRDTIAERQVEKAAETQKAARVTLTARPEDGGKRLALTDAAHPTIASIDVAFPRALGVPPKTALLDPRIEADWFAKPVLKVTDGGADAIEGRMPVLITATVGDGDARVLSRAIYDVVFATEGHVLGGRTLLLRGVLLRERASSGATERLDSFWADETRRLAAVK